MFAVMALEGPVNTSCPSSAPEEKFNELIEQEGMEPAPYMARNKWVGIERFDVLSDKELKSLLRNSYEWCSRNCREGAPATGALPQSTIAPKEIFCRETPLGNFNESKNFAAFVWLSYLFPRDTKSARVWSWPSRV
jgi:hypothetical protein